MTAAAFHALSGLAHAGNSITTAIAFGEGEVKGISALLSSDNIQMRWLLL